MRFPIVLPLMFGLTAVASAEIAPASPSVTGQSRSLVSVEKSAHDAAVENCEQTWDRGTHMTKQEWSRTCRRVQNRLQQLHVK